MITETFIYKAHDGMDIFTYKWSPENTAIRGIVQIAHGLCEHAGRYLNFATYLTASGYVVYAHDQRGHGKTAKDSNNLVYISDGGWNAMQKDLISLTNIIKVSYPNLSIFLFGHSMGSFILRNVLQKFQPNVKGVIFSGTGCYEGIALNAGILIARTLVKRKGPLKRSYYINKLTFQAFNSNISEPKTFFDWLSRDEKVIIDLLNDPLYKIHCTNNLFLELFTGLKEIQSKKNIAEIPKNIPVLFVSGDNDPVGHWGKDILELVNLYKNLGIKNVQYKLYPGARHEVINEINKMEVMHDIINWMNSITDKN